MTALLAEADRRVFNKLPINRSLVQNTIVFFIHKNIQNFCFGLGFVSALWELRTR
jgi:hypothetical protein